MEFNLRIWESSDKVITLPNQRARSHSFLRTIFLRRVNILGLGFVKWILSLRDKAGVDCGFIKINLVLHDPQCYGT